MLPTVLNNTLYLSLSSSVALSISFVFNIFLARFFGVEQFGEFSFVMSFITIFSVLVEFSLDSVVIRNVARTPVSAGLYFGNALALKGALFLLTFLLIAATSQILGYPARVRMFLYILSLALLFEGAKRCCVSLFEATQKMKFPAVILIVERTLFVFLGFGAVVVFGTVTAVILCYVVAQVVTCLASLFLVRRELGLRPERVEFGLVKRLMRYAFPFFSISLTAALYADIDKIFLFSMVSGGSVGLYAAAYKLVAIPVQFSNAFHRALYPLLSKHAASTDKTLLPETYRRSMRYLVLGAIPIGVGMTVFAEPMMRVTYGNAYMQGIIALKVLVWAYILEFFNPFLSRVLYAIGRERYVLAASVLGTVLNIGFNILLIPRYDILGAAIATLLSASLILLVLLFSVFRVFPNVSLINLAVKPVLAGVGMWMVCILLGDMWPIPLAIAGVVVYCICLLLTRAFSLEELLAFRRMLSAGIG